MKNMGNNLLSKDIFIIHKICVDPPVTWSELGLWGIIGVGALLGSLKIYAPISPSIISLAYDFLCFGVLFYVVFRRIKHSRKLPYISLFLPLFLFVGFSALTILNPHLTFIARGVLGWRFLSSSLLFFFLGFYAFSNVRRVWRLLDFFWITSVVVTIYGIVQFVRGYTPAEMEWIKNLAATMNIAGTGRYRIMATFGAAVDFGFFLSLATISLFGVSFIRRYRNPFWLISITLMLVGLFFTLVRTVWVATFVGFLFLMVTKLWRVKNIRLLLPSLVLVGFLAISLFPFAVGFIANQINDLAVQERIGSLADPFNDQSMLERYDRWEEIWQLTKKYPWGVGVGMTGSASLQYEKGGEIPVTMDNSYLKIIVETGWLGLIIFIFLIVSILVKMKQTLRCLQGENKVLGISLIATFLTYLIVLFFGEYIELNPARLLVWIFLGIFFSLPRLQKLGLAQ